MTHGSDEPNALLQIDRGPGRGRPEQPRHGGGGAQRPRHRLAEPLAVPRLRRRRGQRPPVAALRRRLLLQDLHVAALASGTRSTSRSIRAAAGLGRAPDRAPTPTATPTATPIATCWWSARARPASRPRSRPRRPASASSSSTSRPSPAARSCTTSPRRSTASRRRTGPRRRSRRSTRARTSSLLPRTTAFGYYNHNHVAWSSASPTTSKPPPATLAARAALAGARRRGGAGDRLARAPARLRRQRPARHHARRERAGLRQPLRRSRPGRRIVIRDERRLRLCGRRATREAAGLDVTVVDLRLEADCGPEVAEACARRAARCSTGHTVVGSTGRKRVTGLIVAPIEAGRPRRRRGARSPATRSACRAAGRRPSTCSRSRAASSRFDPDLDAFVPGAVRAGRALGRRRAGAPTTSPPACRRALRPAPRRPAAPATRAFAGDARRRPASSPCGVLPTDGNPARVRAFVDFQNDVTAKDIKLAVREGFESVEHVKRYTTTGMATDQGKTSNMNALGLIAGTLDKAIPAVGTTTFRPPYTPVTFGALVGPARDAAVRSRPHDADPRLGGRARGGLRERRPVEARLVLPEARRGHARGRRARVQGGARRRRHLRRLDARQDRGRRARTPPSS